MMNFGQDELFVYSVALLEIKYVHDKKAFFQEIKMMMTYIFAESVICVMDVICCYVLLYVNI